VNKTMTEEDERNDEEGFKVTDRRMFTAEGEVRPQEQEEQAAASPPTEVSGKPPAPEETRSRSEPEDETRERVDFASFLISLATTGMVHMGEIPEPTTGQVMQNLEGARQMIEILTLLKEKTGGNLSGEEEHLLENLLYELRMKFLSKSKVIKF